VKSGTTKEKPALVTGVTGGTPELPSVVKTTTTQDQPALILPGDPPPVDGSTDSGASLKSNAFGGKPALDPGGTVSHHQAAQIAKGDYDAKKASAYTADVNYTAGPDQAATAEYLALLDQRWQGRRVLDIGCGEGKVANEYPPLKHARLVVGVDLSTPFLQQAHQERRDNTGFARADMTLLPVMSASMDAVISRFALHYTPDLEQLFREIARVLKAGGELTFVCNMIHGKDGAPIPDPVLNDPWIPIRLSEQLTVSNLGHGDQRYFDALSAAGFEVELVKRHGANHKISAEYPHKDQIELEAVIVRAKKRAD
jgi:SAM-dependent methyltransferase